MSLLWPGFLLLLGLIPLSVVVYLWMLRRRHRSALRYSSLLLVREALPAQSTMRRHLPFALLLIGLSSLIVAVARPVEGGQLLQVSAFSSADNAERAHARLDAAGVAGAQVVAGEAAGRPVWRLRVGPVATDAVEAVSSQLAALGFDAVRPVRD